MPLCLLGARLDADRKTRHNRDVNSDTLKVVDGTVAGAWIEPRLRGGFGAQVQQQIPVDYEAYVRIFHPARDTEGNAVTWAEVAGRLGRTAHREMQWHAIVGSPDPPQMTGSEWSGENPNIGELESEALEALCAILARHTNEAADCFFGLSTIHGGVEDALGTKPLLRFPHREFVILTGPLSAVDEVGFISSGSSFSFTALAWTGGGAPPEPEPSERLWQQAPNLIWPADRAWYVASEYDFDSTLAGGSKDLIEEIMAEPQLETWVVSSEDSLSEDADKVNLLPPGDN